MPKKAKKTRNRRTGPQNPAARSAGARRGAGPHLHELAPPGEHYEEWFELAGHTPDPAAVGVGTEAADMAARLQRLAPAYGGKVPKAALLLDYAIDAGTIHMHTDDGPVPFPLAAATAPLLPGGPPAQTETELRGSFHALHAAGALLMTDEGSLRPTAGRPEPGRPWRFQGDPGTELEPSTCLPTGAMECMTAEQLGALAYMRMRHSNNEPTTAEDLAHHEGITLGKARELVTTIEASGWLTEYGCPACPSAHLCTRDTDEDIAS